MAAQLSQIILESPDQKNLQKFYIDLGLKFDATIDKKRIARDKNGKKCNGVVLAIFKPTKNVSSVFSGNAAVVINTNDLDSTVTLLGKKWPNCFIGPIDADAVGNRTVLLLDPDGRKIFLIEPARFAKERAKKGRK